jgi:hypothetical protein
VWPAWLCERGLSRTRRNSHPGRATPAFLEPAVQHNQAMPDEGSRVILRDGKLITSMSSHTRPGRVNAVNCQPGHIMLPVTRLQDSTVDDHDQSLLRSVLHHPAIDGRVDPGIPLPWPVGWGRRALRRWNVMSRRRAGRMPRRWWRRYGDDVKEPPPGSPGLLEQCVGWIQARGELGHGPGRACIS